MDVFNYSEVMKLVKKGSVFGFTIFLVVRYWGALGVILKIIIYISAASIGALLGCRSVLFTEKKYTVKMKQSPENAALKQLLAKKQQEYKQLSKQDIHKPTTLVSRSVDAVISELIDFIIRDFVIWWYRNMVREHQQFIKLLKDEIWVVLSNFKERLRKMDDVKFITNDIVRKIHNHLQKFRFASSGTSQDKVPFVLASYLAKKEDELQYLRVIIDFFLAVVLPVKYAQCQPLRHLLREIITCFALHRLMETVCDPDYINQKLINYLQWQQVEMERHNRTYTCAETYEDFIEMIRQCSDVETLKRMRYYIVSEIMQATTISNLKRAKGIDADKEFSPQTITKGDLLQSRNLKRYINELGIAKTHCEKRIKMLCGAESSSVRKADQESPAEDRSSIPGKKVLSLSVIMESGYCRRFFAKYLEKDESYSLIGFWESVEEMKQADKTVQHQLGNDIVQTYINNPSSIVRLPKNILKGIEAFMMANKGPEAFYQAQEEVYNILEERFYHSFIVSDIYHKMITEAEKNGIDFTRISEDICEEQGNPSTDSPLKETKDDIKVSLIDHSSHARSQLNQLENRLANKIQALQALHSNPKSDSKMIQKLGKEIEEMRTEKNLLQDHISKTELWIKYLGFWQATVQEAEISKEQKSVPYFSILVHLGSIPTLHSKSSGWVVYRNINAFHCLHQKLIPAASWLKKIELPSQSRPRFKGYDQNFLNRAKAYLQNFLTVVMKNDELNKSEALYTFLSPSPDHLKCPLSPPKKQSRSWILKFFRSVQPIGQTDVSDEDELLFLDDAEGKEDRKDSIAEPLYSLIGEIFELKGVFNWLRRTLIVFVQITDGKTINRQLHETVAWITSEPMLLYYLQIFRDSMWPGGELIKPTPPRSQQQKQETREEAKQLLLNNIPDVLCNLVGQQNARKGVAKVFEALQDIKLNKQLFCDILEAFIYEFAPELRCWQTAGTSSDVN